MKIINLLIPIFVLILAGCNHQKVVRNNIKYNSQNNKKIVAKHNTQHSPQSNKKINKFEAVVQYIYKKQLLIAPKPPKGLKLVKDEFETQKEFEARVSKAKAKQQRLVAIYESKIQKIKVKAKKIAIKKALQYVWGKPIVTNLKYDADNEIFVANISFEKKDSFNKKVAIKVKRDIAREFKKSFSNLKPKAIFEVINDSVSLKEIKIAFKSKNHIAMFTDYDIQDLKTVVTIADDYNINTKIDTNIIIDNSKVAHLDSSKLKDFGELERLLRNAKQERIDNKKWLFIIGIEQYENTANIVYARRTAKMFAKVAQKTLGIGKHHTFILLDSKATSGAIKNKFKRMLRGVKEGDSIYFYYNGHGIPAPNRNNEPFMLAYDIEPDFVSDDNFFDLKNIYGKLSSSKANKVIAFVDSCFSGMTDKNVLIKGVAATRLRARKVKLDKNKMVVLTAGKGYQYSNGYDKRGYRLFSYYVMKNIIEGKKDIKSLYKNIKKQTYQTSYEEYGDMRVQEPQIYGNKNFGL